MNIETIIIVLGFPNTKDGRLYDVALQRCELTLKEYRKKKCKILLTGGYGKHFNTSNKPHAYHLQQYLTGNGVAKTDILGFVESFFFNFQ